MRTHLHPASSKHAAEIQIDVDDALIQAPADNVFEGDISDLAYRYWEQRQRDHQPGSALDDWLRAEADIARAQGSSTRPRR